MWDGRRAVAAGVLALGLLLPWVLGVAAAAQPTTQVEVRADGYAPDTVTVDAGGSVTWTWVADGHSVTALDGSFDSHPECGLGGGCGTTGETFSWTFETAGEHRYYSRTGVGFSGTVIVQAAPSPSPSTTTTDPSPSPAPSPTPSPTPTPEPEPSPTPAPPPSPQPEPQPAPAPAPRPSPSPSPAVASPPPVATSAPSPEVSEAPPQVASPDDEPSLSPFPSPRSITTDDPTPDTVTVTLPDEGGGPPRTAVLAIATVAVIGSAGAFGALVLFGEPWA